MKLASAHVENRAQIAEKKKLDYFIKSVRMLALTEVHSKFLNGSIREDEPASFTFFAM